MGADGLSFSATWKENTTLFVVRALAHYERHELAYFLHVSRQNHLFRPQSLRKQERACRSDHSRWGRPEGQLIGQDTMGGHAKRLMMNRVLQGGEPSEREGLRRNLCNLLPVNMNTELAALLEWAQQNGCRWANVEFVNTRKPTWLLA